jgi:hypothetical protein
MMDTILLPLVHDNLSCGTAISHKTLARLGTSLVMCLVTNVTGQAMAFELPQGYTYQDAYLQTETMPQSPCQNRRTVTQEYEYTLPQETQEYEPHQYQQNPEIAERGYGDSGLPSYRFNIGSQNTIVIDLF